MILKGGEDKGTRYTHQTWWKGFFDLGARIDVTRIIGNTAQVKYTTGPGNGEAEVRQYVSTLT